ncbi:uncharacterized protein BX664DRAFT_327128 [Halteromyces radiatus]|uniref:uncharacterized protein n=1 Tax=Halteromyces radiatus TaxID=101107 RepID=UPI00221FACDB|nr:uncharacterized protein BX664DRAFT_327128 [Halteromyces radiatus]KAI8097731.1 hypothetical protein BX664DRAFT_327128 [Halteromyces radiatus]
MNNKNKQSHSTDLLNIPGKNKTLAKLLSTDSKQNEDTPMIPPPELRKTFKITPNNDILSRVQSFLPQLQAANQQLQSADLADLDIENVKDDSEQYIEMNLGLGVYETKPQTDTSDEDEDDIVIPHLNNNNNNNNKNNNNSSNEISSRNSKGIKPKIELLDNNK